VNPIGWVHGLEGLSLAAVLAGFLFFEEAGLPIPFAPLIVGALAMVLSTVWVVGFLALGIGALSTRTYASWVMAYLVGIYAATTDTAASGGPPAASRPGAVPRGRAS